MRNSLTKQEGWEKGVIDRERNYCYDPYRWIKAWALTAWKFESGYYAGFYNRN